MLTKNLLWRYALPPFASAPPRGLDLWNRLNRNETDFSTQYSQARPYPRLPCPHGDPWWAQGAKGPAGQGSRASDPLIGGTLPQSERFSRAARLRDPDAYRRVFAKPVRSSDSLFTVLARANGVGGARLGLAISKKQLRRAVERNRIKRMVRESFRQQRPSLPPIDLVVLARRDTGRATSFQLRDSLRLHWQRLAGQCRKS